MITMKKPITLKPIIILESKDIDIKKKAKIQIAIKSIQKLSFSLSKPYVNYTLKLFSNNPGFKQGLSNYLTIGVN